MSAEEQSNGARAFLLQWFETEENVLPVGLVVLQEVQDIFQSGPALSLLTVVVADSPRAIKASGGRTSLVLECGTPGECAKYRLTLQTLRAAQ